MSFNLANLGALLTEKFSGATRCRRQSPTAPGKFRLRGESLEHRRMLTFDPSPIEQALLESINRFRDDPQAELDVLFSSLNPLEARDASSQRAIEFFNVDREILLQQWSQLQSAPPLAWNEQLIDAALGHTELLVQTDMQTHQVPGEPALGDRIRNEGYQLTRATENVYSFAANHIHAHAGFVVDWGDGPGGIQSPAGHRINILDDQVTEVGIAVLTDNNPATSVGPNIVTQDFGTRSDYNSQILGVVWQDGNDNGIYDPGEGFGDRDITLVSRTGETFTTQTLSAGGYQVEVPEGIYEVRMEGFLLSGPMVVGNVELGNDNVKVDFQIGAAGGTGNIAPFAAPDTADVTEGTSTTINILTNDFAPSGTIVSNSVLIVDQATNGQTSVSTNGVVTYTPNRGFSGTETFSYTVRDSNGATSNEATVTVNVTARPGSTPPVANDDYVASVDGGVVSIPVLSNDSAFDSQLTGASIEIVGQSPNGSAEVVGNSIRYTPGSQTIVGADTISYRITDSQGTQSSSATVNVYRVLSESAWQNPVNSLDVNGDGQISPLDALQAINNIGITLNFPSTAPQLNGGPPPFVDVDNNGIVSPLDALLVINELNNDTGSVPPPASSLSLEATVVPFNPADDLVENDREEEQSIVDRIFAETGSAESV